MAAPTQSSHHWHLDKRVPIALIVVMTVQFILLVTFFAGLDWRIRALEAQAVTDARISVIETNMVSIDRDVERLEMRTVNALEDIRSKLDRIDKRLEARN